jgi:phage terminase large subunit-like protein
MSEMSWTPTGTQNRAIDLLSGDAGRILLSGGSRSGKTFLLCFAVFLRALKEPGSQHAIGRLHFTHVVSSLAYQTIPKMLDVCFPGLIITLNRQHWFYELPNKSQIWLFGFDQKERVEKILGTEWSTIYLNEASMLEWNLVTMALTRLAAKTKLKNRLYLDQNPPSKAHWTYKVFIQHVNPENGTALTDPDNWATLQMNPGDNLHNLSEDYLSTLESLPERARKRFLMGEYADEIQGALWNEVVIDKNRVDELPDSIVLMSIGVDPAGSRSLDAADTGIMVCAKSSEGHYYVIKDATGKYSPNGWATRIAALYYGHRADRVVAEQNYGGEMVEANLRTVDNEMKIVMVNATRGKIIRAEPISGLYEQGLVHHIGYFSELEDEMVHYTGEPGQKSPNRLDALVWALTDLMGSNKKESWVSGI